MKLNFGETATAGPCDPSQQGAPSQLGCPSMIGVPKWLGCPLCQLPLSQRDDYLVCVEDSLAFPSKDGLLHLLPPEWGPSASTFAADYRKRRQKQGWRSLTQSEMASLPEVSPAGWDRSYWQVRQQSVNHLESWMEVRWGPEARLRVVDMGAGTGWLTLRLAFAGHEAAAVDLSTDEAFGLGTMRRKGLLGGPAFALVVGSMEHPPVQQRQVDLVIYNASLHYTADIEACIIQGAALLRPGGAMVIMDSPVVDEERRSSWAGGRQLEKKQLIEILDKADLAYRYEQVQRSIRWHLQQLKLRMAGAQTFDLPFIVVEPG